MPFWLQTLPPQPPHYKHTRLTTTDPDDSDSDSSPDLNNPPNIPTPSIILVKKHHLAISAVVLIALAGSLGFWVGRNGHGYVYDSCQQYQRQQQQSHDDFVGLGIGGGGDGDGDGGGDGGRKQSTFHSDKKFRKTFDYNESFARAPSEESNGVWGSLFPEGMGYISDPTGHLELYGVSAFHQLHCLDLLRHLYYAAALNTPDQATPDPPMSPHLHARHCFDYVRQALMCAADGTLERGDPETRVVTGEGAVHVCGDFEGLKMWVGERAVGEG